MSHDPHGQQQIPWMIIAAVFYAVTFIFLLAAAIIFGGPITAGLFVWFAVLAIHAFIYVCINR